MKKHTVRKRIFISHAMMILVTIFFMFLVNLGIVKIYWERMEQEWQFSMETMADTASVEELLEECTLHQRSFYMLLAADVLICIGVLILVSLFFSRELVSYIMKPMEALEKGVRRIQDNVLTEEIVYEGDAEFEEICDTFNEMQAHILAEQEKNRKYEKARTEMVAGLSHDLRTPLTAVRGTVKALMDGIVKVPEQQEKFLRTAYRRTGDMDVLLNQLFYLSKLETGNMPLHLKNIDLAHFIRSYGEGKRESLDPEKIKLSVSVENAEGQVEADPEQLHSYGPHQPHPRENRG